MDKVEIHVISVVGTPRNDNVFAVIVGDREEKRYFPILVGPAEAQSVVAAVQHIRLPRPLTHDVFASFIRETGHMLEEVDIYKSDNGVYSAWLCFDGGLKIDSRASDAIALALRMRCLMYVSEDILARDNLVGLGNPRKAEMHVITPEEEIERLRKKLDKAVKNDNFELAIKLRDIIQELSEKGKDSAGHETKEEDDI